MKRIMLALGASLALLVPLGVTAAASASINPNATVQIKSTDGGCLKDRGAGATYSVSSCNVSSNFTRTGYNIGGVEVYTYKDGSGYCVTASGSAYEAGTCVGASTQQFYDPSPEMQTVEDVQQSPQDEMLKWGPIGGIYYAFRDTQTDGYDNAWTLS